jgi:hypothetical protein
LKTEKFVMNFVTISSAVDRFHGNGKWSDIIGVHIIIKIWFLPKY